MESQRPEEILKVEAHCSPCPLFFPPLFLAGLASSLCGSPASKTRALLTDPSRDIQKLTCETQKQVEGSWTPGPRTVQSMLHTTADPHSQNFASQYPFPSPRGSWLLLCWVFWSFLAGHSVQMQKPLHTASTAGSSRVLTCHVLSH